MRIATLASIVLLGFTSPASALPTCTLPSPTELNLYVPQPKANQPKVVAPLITRSYLAAIEGEACQALRNGVESAFVKADLYQKITAQPTRSYRYGEVWKLAGTIYDRQSKCRVYTANKPK
ncbi:hypothetical protein [Chamaesiphon sp.]|uniref:hypothetical protein n=1 Tax=Chamaesiphon sp. TaxID=2814140 RepID=UPI003592F6E7